MVEILTENVVYIFKKSATFAISENKYKLKNWRKVFGKNMN